MTLNECVSELCRREGKKKIALDAGQAREVLARLREIIGEEVGIDLYDVIAAKSIYLDMSVCSKKHGHYEAFPMFPWSGGKPVKK